MFVGALALLSLMGAMRAVAQEPAGILAQRQAIQKLDAWVGEWTGAGWASGREGQRHEFTITETVQRKIGGAILLVEGLGTSKNEATGEDMVTHDALAVLSYDDKVNCYRWRAHDNRGQSIDTQPKVAEGTMEWTLRNEEAAMSMRFTIKIAGDQWHEIGELSRDGKTWNTFMEMSLRRKK